MLPKKLAHKFRKHSQKLVGTRWKYTRPAGSFSEEFLLQVVSARKKQVVVATVYQDHFESFQMRRRELFTRFSPFEYIGKESDMEWLRVGRWVIAKDETPILIPQQRGAWCIDYFQNNRVHLYMRPNQYVYHPDIFHVISTYREATAEEIEQAPRLPEPAVQMEAQEEQLPKGVEIAPTTEPEVERQPFWKNLVEEDV